MAECSGRKILIVDDNLEFAEMVTRILGEEGYKVSIAPDGSTAIERVLSESPELVLLDLKLPDITGREVLKRIKAINEDTAIIVITGYGGEQVAVDLMKAGAMDFLSKPIENEDLLKAVRNALAIRDAQMDDKRLENHSSLEKFFPFLAHEIRNPLHAIGGAIAVIERRSDLKDDLLQQSIKIIKDEIQHLNDFVKECLDFIRPPVKGYFNEVGIKEVISLAMNVVSHIYEESFGKIKVISHMDPQLPMIMVNYEEIKQVFLNILKNSFEAMEGGGELIIRTCFKSDPLPGCIEVVFIDNGVGIKKEHMKHLFQPFFKTKLRGTGLGLAICRRIVEERHHGKIYIVSEEGKGTTVRVELPITQAMGISGEKIL
jgi:signal transduction histidine kinase